MKKIITAAAIALLASTAASANWDMPFFGDGNNNSNGTFNGNGAGDTAGNYTGKGNGSADGEAEFSFAMNFKGRGSSKMDADTTGSYNGKGNGTFTGDSATTTASQAYPQYGYRAPVAAPAAPAAK